MLKEIIFALVCVISVVCGYPQFGYGGDGWGAQGLGGEFGGRSAQGGSVDLSGQREASNSNFGPFGDSRSQSEVSGNLQATGFDNQAGGGFGGGGFGGGYGGYGGGW